MNELINIIQNNGLASITAGASHNVLGAIHEASEKVGVDFAYMVQQAKAESSFRPQIEAATSSATGLYQFIEKTWLSMVRDHGADHGLQEYASAIDENFKVSDPALREEILELRKDPEIASVMAAEFASQNERILNNNWGGEIGSTELYFAHFLGPGQASAFLNARDQNPAQEAALLFPRAAEANQNVFFDPSTKRARSIEEVYQFFDRKFQVEGDGTPKPDSVVFDVASKSEHISESAPNTPSKIFKPKTVAVNYVQPQTHVGSYASLVHNPVDIMMLTQMDSNDVFSGGDDENKNWF